LKAPNTRDALEYTAVQLVTPNSPEAADCEAEGERGQDFEDHHPKNPNGGLLTDRLEMPDVEKLTNFRVLTRRPKRLKTERESGFKAHPPSLRGTRP
jgi:hypothetical protein